ncbi:MAG TPA: endonuclease/exonuclease/phosphatase family protein, partial [Chitinophagales bacterium]|nr:endonuclease/exonuclease/phosphatase family protein [Chitinophagales bacterium]
MLKRYLHLVGYVVFGSLALITLVATVVPLIPSKQWYVRIFDYPRLQTWTIAVLALSWYAVFYFKRGRNGYAYVVILVVAIVVQGYKAWPYTPLARKQVLWSEKTVDEATTVSLFICNVLQKNAEYAKVLAAVNTYNPDIFITTESDAVWQHELREIEDRFPHRIAVPQSNTYGMHVYSKLPLREADVRYLVEPDIPSIRTAVQLRTGDWVMLYVVHPRPPVPTEASDTKERDAELVMV